MGGGGTTSTIGHYQGERLEDQARGSSVEISENAANDAVNDDKSQRERSCNVGHNLFILATTTKTNDGNINNRFISTVGFSFSLSLSDAQQNRSKNTYCQTVSVDGIGGHCEGDAEEQEQVVKDTDPQD